MEVATSYIQNGVVKKAIGEECKSFSSYLLAVSFFILINNPIGIVPVLPRGTNITGNITVTGILAPYMFIAVNLFATKVHWKGTSWPKAPIYSRLPLPIMPFMKFFGVLTKPFVLMTRLFTNIMTDHTAILALTYLIFITVTMGVAVSSGMTIVSVLSRVLVNCLELLVACLQAYIFTLLSTSYTGLAKVRE